MGLHRLGLCASFAFLLLTGFASAADSPRAVACREAVEPTDIIAACTEALDPYGKPLWALIRRGHAFLDDGQTEPAREDAMLAVRAAAKNSDAHALLGRALRDAGDYEAALKSLDRAILLDEDNAAAFFYRAQLYYWRDDKQKALEDIVQSVAIDGGNLDFRYWRGVISDELGDHATALSDFSWVISVDAENPEYLDSRAWTYFTLGRFAEALADIDHALQLDPGLATPHETRGHVFYSSNRREEAAAELRTALDLDSERSLARQLLAWIAVTTPLAPRDADCGPLSSIRKKLAGTKVTLNADSVRAGEAVTLAWSVPSIAIRPDQPTYLVTTLPEAVRLEGRGFFALTPGARGPYGMSYGAASVRAITPLHVKGAPSSGEITIIPYTVGALPIEWQIVQISACGEKTALNDNKATVDVTPGIPELVPLDDAASGAAVAELQPLAGRFRAQVLKSAVEVVDAATGDTVLKAAGRNPAFSPSGRFLVVEADSPEINDVYDLIAVRKLGRFGPGRLFWGHNDSFLFVDAVDGRLQVVRTLNGSRFSPAEPVVAEASSDDIGTPIGAEGKVPGSDAWDLDLSVEAGTIAFANKWFDKTAVPAAEETISPEELTGEGDIGDAEEIDTGAAAFNPEPPGLDIADLGLIVPLGDPGATRQPMPKDELPNELTSGYGLPQPSFLGWNNHDALWQARLGKGPETVAGTMATALGTQRELPPARLLAVGENGGAIELRPTKPMPRPADNSEGAASVAGVLFGHLGGEPVPALRAGRDTRGIDHIQRELEDIFPTYVAYFEKDETGERPVQPIPDPYPYGLPDEPASIDLNKPQHDLWTGRFGGERFWLSQSAAAGDGEAVHELTLLGTSKDGTLRYANLLPDANALVATLGKRAIARDFDMRVAGDLAAPWGEPSTVTLAAERYLTIVTRPVPHLLVFDLQDWKLVCAIPRPRNPANVADVAFHADLGHVTQVNRSGQVEVYACADGAHVLTAMYTDGEMVVVDKSGHFEGSWEAAGAVTVRIPGVSGRHLLSQFVSRLWVSDLARRILAGEQLEPGSVFDPPRLAVSAPAEGADASLVVHAESAVGLETVDIIADGRPLKHVAAEVEDKGKKKKKAKAPETSISVALAAAELAGRGIVTVIATDRNGIASAPIELLSAKSKNQRAPKTFLLAVGVGRYREIDDAELRYSAGDATRLAKSVARSLYSNTATATLTDTEATVPAIMENLERMVAEAGPDDTIMLSFAGHGLRGKDGSLRLALTDTNLYEVDATSLDFTAVQGALAKTKARVLLLLDVTHANLAKRTEIATNDDVAGMMTAAAGTQMVVLSATRGKQFSELTTTLSGGRLSVAIRDILVKDRAVADTDGNGNISVHELFRAARAAVAHGSGGHQTPWIARGGLAGDFDIF